MKTFEILLITLAVAVCATVFIGLLEYAFGVVAVFIGAFILLCVSFVMAMIHKNKEADKHFKMREREWRNSIGKHSVTIREGKSDWTDLSEGNPDQTPQWRKS